MLLAQEANAKSGCFGSRNSPCPSYGMRLRFQNQQNRVRSGLAVPAEKRSYVLSARITQESTPQGRRDLGAQIPGHESGRQKRRTLSPSLSTTSATISSNDSASKTRRTSSRLKYRSG